MICHLSLEMSIFNNEQEKSHEWAEAKRQLTGSNGQLLENGTKLRRKDSGLNHSFMVIDNRILAFNVQGEYLGRGNSGKVKLAEDEKGRLFAVKVQSRPFKKSETDIAYDLGVSGEKTKRGSQYKWYGNDLKYDLALMSDLNGDENKAKQGKIYLSKEGNYNYIVRDTAGNLQKGKLDNINLNGLEQKIIDSHFKEIVLVVTSKADHTQYNRPKEYLACRYLGRSLFVVIQT